MGARDSAHTVASSNSGITPEEPWAIRRPSTRDLAPVTVVPVMFCCPANVVPDGRIPNGWGSEYSVRYVQHYRRFWR